MALNFGGLSSIFGRHLVKSEGFAKLNLGQFDWSINGCAFQPANQDAGDANFDDVYYSSSGIEAAGGSFPAFCPVTLPHGVTVISVEVKGGDGADLWALQRVNSLGVKTTMANGTFNSISTSITDPLINNAKYSYVIETGEVGDTITQARITYDQ